MNRTIRELLLKCAKGSNRWVAWIPWVQLMVNAKRKERVGTSSFELMFARPSLGFEVAGETQPLDDDERFALLHERQQELVDLVFPAVRDRAAARRLKDKNQVRRAKYRVGMQVMVRDPTRTSKWMPRFEGPFIIHKITRNGNFVLRDQQGRLLTRNVTLDMMKMAGTPPVTESDVFEVDSILAHREVDGRVSYLVRWKDQSPENDSWEPVENIFDEGCLRQYWSRRGRTPE